MLTRHFIQSEIPTPMTSKRCYKVSLIVIINVLETPYHVN